MSVKAKFQRILVRRAMSKISPALMFTLLWKTIAVCCVLFAGNVFAQMRFDERSLGDAIWLTFTTLSTTGYGDLSPVSPQARTTTVVLMYMCGIFLFAQMLSIVWDLGRLRYEDILKGKWKMKFSDHIVVFNAPDRGAFEYFDILKRSLVESCNIEDDKVSVLVSNNISADVARKVMDDRFVWLAEDPNASAAYTASNIGAASHVAILAVDSACATSDAINIDIVRRVREQNASATIVVEAVLVENAERFKAAGADAVIRPMRSYPEMMTRVLMVPGVEKIMFDLFDSEGEEVVAFKVDYEGLWKDAVVALIEHDLGTPLAYMDKSGDIHMNTSYRDAISAQEIFIVVREGNPVTRNQVKNALSNNYVVKRK